MVVFYTKTKKVLWPRLSPEMPVHQPAQNFNSKSC